LLAAHGLYQVKAGLLWIVNISWDEAITLMNEGYMLYPPVALQLKPPPG
jgi:hypothetical protein